MSEPVPNEPPPENRFATYAPIAAVYLFTFVLALVTYLASTSQTPNKSVIALLQVLTLLAGIGVSIYLGRRTATKAAEEVIRPHARSSFRRVLSLREALIRLAQNIETRRSDLDDFASRNGGQVEIEVIHLVMDSLGSLVAEQASTASDAADDWKDIIPDDVWDIDAQVRRSAIAPILSPKPINHFETEHNEDFSDALEPTSGLESEDE